MKKKRQSRAGFVLVTVTFLIAVVGLEIFILADSSNTVLFQSDRILLEAVEENLAASGLVWAKVNIGKGGIAAGQETTLEMPEEDGRQRELKVTVVSINQGHAQVLVYTSCRHGRQHLEHSAAYDIEF